MSNKKNVYPSKTTLNLVIKDRPPYYARAILLGILIGIIVIGAFAKFAVIDRISAANNLAREAETEQARYEQLVSDNAIFAEVRAEYEKYFTKVGDGASYADSMEALALIEKDLMTVGQLQSATLSKNELSVVLTGIDLEQTSSIVKALYSNPIVAAVSVSSADTTVEGTYSFVSLSITLIAEIAEGGDAA